MLRTRIARITIATAVTLGIGALGAGPTLASTWDGPTGPDALILSEDAAPAKWYSAAWARSEDAPDALIASEDTDLIRNDSPEIVRTEGPDFTYSVDH